MTGSLREPFKNYYIDGDTLFEVMFFRVPIFSTITVFFLSTPSSHNKTSPIPKKTFFPFHLGFINDIMLAATFFTAPNGERLTSLEASLVRCFVFYKTSSKTSGGNVFFKNIAIALYKTSHCCFTRCFRFQKAHPETESMTNSLLIIKPRRPHS